MPGSCPFWLADTAGWKNSAGICRRGLEPSVEKGLGGAAGEEEEVLVTAQEVGTEHQPSLGLLNTGCETAGKSPTSSAGFFAVRTKILLVWFLEGLALNRMLPSEPSGPDSRPVSWAFFLWKWGSRQRAATHPRRVGLL